MDHHTRLLIGFGLGVMGFAWFVVIKVWRGQSRDHSARMFWLHLTAPLVAMVLLVVGLALVAATLWDARGDAGR